MTADQWGNLAGLAGTALVIFPALKATRIFQLAEEAKKVVQKIPSQQAQLTTWAQQLHDDVASLREEWQPRDAVQLFTGILLTGVSDLLPLLKSWGWLSQVSFEHAVTRSIGATAAPHVTVECRNVPRRGVDIRAAAEPP